MPVDRRGQSIKSERFGFFVSGLHVPPTSLACSQRDMNHAEYRSGGRVADNQREINDPKSRKNCCS